MGIDSAEYSKILRERAKTSKVYHAHQLLGLELADLLEDRAHKALYIKLAKNFSPQILRELAKDISENKKAKNKGAYFMYKLKMVQDKKI